MRKITISLFLILSATLSATNAMAQPPARELLSLNAWSLAGYSALTTEESFTLPEDFAFGGVAGVSFNSKGHLIVLHRGDQPFAELDANGQFIRSFGSSDLFTRSHGLRIDNEDNLWVTDVSGHIVMKLDSDANLLMQLGTRGEAGDWDENTGSQLFNQPNDVAFDSSNNIYVAQGHGPAEPRILKFDPQGNYISQWGSRGDGPGQFAVAHSIEIDTDDNVYVADRENFRIEKFDTSGQFIEEWNFSAMACGLYLHDDGYMYMTTGFDGEFAKLDMDGNIIGSLGSPGREIGQFGEGHFLTLDGDDNIYIADVVNRRVQVFEKQAASPHPVRRFQ